jgi:DNA invertase Pin-like site-specific DNA recombinase
MEDRMSERHSTNGKQEFSAPDYVISEARQDEPGRLDAVAYHRMSSDLQERSIPQQREWAHTAARRQGVRIVAEFEDAARSGTDAAKRGGFQKMLEFCKQRSREGQPVRVLLTWNTDRFSRADSLETGWYVQEFRMAGVERMLTASGWIDFDRPEHRVLFGIGQDLTNNRYSIDLAEKTTRGHIDAAREGRPQGGPVSFGYVVEYEWVTVRGKRKQRPLRLVPDPEKAPILQWIFALYASGRVSLWELALALDEKAIKPPGKARFWNPTTLAVILRNEVYLGDAVWNRRRCGKFFGTLDGLPVPRTGRRGGEEKVPAQHHVRKPQAHEALVSRDLWGAVQLQLSRRRKLTTPKLANDFRLTGLLVCGHCGGKMLGNHKPLRGRAAKGQHVSSYLCGNYSRHGTRACCRNAILEAPLFAAIARKLKQELLNEDTIARLRKIALARLSSGTGAARQERERLGRRLGEVEGLISTATRKLIQEEEPAVASACRQEIVKLTAEKERLAAAALEADRRQGQEESVADLVEKVVQKMRRFDLALAEGGAAEVRAVLGELVERVELFFTHEQGGRGVMCSFARGLVYLREDVPLVSYLSTVNVRGCGVP